MYLIETVAKLKKKKASSPEVFKQHSSNDFMNFSTYKTDNIRDTILTMQPSTTVPDQGMHCRLPVYSFVTIGEEEFCKLFI